MGQRLVFRCIKNGERFATIYYHWSAYTLNIYEEALTLINGLRANGYNKDMSINDIRIMLAKILYNSSRTDWNGASIHGGASLNDFAKFREIGCPEELLTTDGLSRNMGLIAISECEMNTAEYWADEHPCDFNFDDETFEETTLACYDKDDSYFKEEFDYDEPGKWDHIYKGLEPFDPKNEYIATIKWSDAEAAYKWFEEQYDRTQRRGKYTWIIGVDWNNPNLVYTQVC